MKDFTQKFLCLILSLATVLSLSAPAFAADYSSAETLDGSLTSTLDYSNVKLSNSKELGVENINNELREIFPYGEIVSIVKAIKETLTDSKSIVSLNTNGRKGFVFIKNFGEKIGTEGGKSLNRMKVVIDEYGKVVTAYPIK